MPTPNSTALALVSAQPEEVAEAAIREGENTTTPQPDLPPLDPEAFTPTSLAALDVPSTKEEACAHSWRTTFQVALHSEGSPRTIYRALREGHKKESWSLLRGPSGERFASFKEFCETPVPHGLGRPIDVVERFLFGELGVASELGSRPIVVGRIEDLSMKPSIREASMIQTIRHANVKLRAEQLDKLHIIKMRLSRERQERLTLDDVLREAADMYVRYHEAAGNIAHEGDPVSAAGGAR